MISWPFTSLCIVNTRKRKGNERKGKTEEPIYSGLGRGLDYIRSHVTNYKVAIIPSHPDWAKWPGLKHDGIGPA
jgi:hypothetical protein